MTDKKFEKAKELKANIAYDKEVIGILDTMLAHFYDDEQGVIKVSYQPASGHILVLKHRDLPELRDALVKAHDRFVCKLRKESEEFQDL
jgi:hypothetical protein